MHRVFAYTFFSFLGLHCVAQCTLDGCWYRAEILDVRRDNDLIEMSIIFVDYGSNDYICDASKSVTRLTVMSLLSCLSVLLLTLYFHSTL